MDLVVLWIKVETGIAFDAIGTANRKRPQHVPGHRQADGREPGGLGSRPSSPIPYLPSPEDSGQDCEARDTLARVHEGTVLAQLHEPMCGDS
jgi:hypothetical protein